MMMNLRSITMSKHDADADLMAAVAQRIGERLNDTANLHGGSITADETSIAVPAVAINGGAQTFRATLTKVAADRVQLRVVGTADGTCRGVQMQFVLQPGSSGIFNYGVASRSKIIMTGNPSILSAHAASDASVLSATYSTNEAVKITGNCRIDGDVSTSNPDSYVSLTGNYNIGGATGWAGVQDHIHIGIGEVDFPEIDPTVYAPFVPAIPNVDSHTNTNGNKTFTNIRIKAGTNPTFAGNITIKGVVYIEKPNKVTFTGNLDLTGVIVTEDAGDNQYNNSYINFTGNMASQGVEALPDTPAFHDLRQMPGLAILAPGFGVKFTGNFHTMNGTIAADKFTFTGNAGGTVYGSVICYSDSDFTLTGNSSLLIDRSHYEGTPPGFILPSTLAADSGSYGEFKP